MSRLLGSSLIGGALLWRPVVGLLEPPWSPFFQRPQRIGSVGLLVRDLIHLNLFAAVLNDEDRL